jgi:hypothetical protein
MSPLTDLVERDGVPTLEPELDTVGLRTERRGDVMEVMTSVVEATEDPVEAMERIARSAATLDGERDPEEIVLATIPTCHPTDRVEEATASEETPLMAVDLERGANVSPVVSTPRFPSPLRPPTCST